jgi:hypothetical protein
MLHDGQDDVTHQDGGLVDAPGAGIVAQTLPKRVDLLRITSVQMHQRARRLVHIMSVIAICSVRTSMLAFASDSIVGHFCKKQNGVGLTFQTHSCVSL